MNYKSIIVLTYCLLDPVISFSMGVTQCAGPSHASGRAKASREDVEVFTTPEGELNISGGTPIKGFLITGSGIQFSDIPEHSELTGVCGSPTNSLSHSNSTPRNSIVVRYSCDEGVEFVTLSIYLVYGYRIPHVSLSGNVRCSPQTTQLPSEEPSES